MILNNKNNFLHYANASNFPLDSILFPNNFFANYSTSAPNNNATYAMLDYLILKNNLPGSGIYIIKNIKTGFVYVGMSNNFGHRLYKHAYNSLHGWKGLSFLYNSMSKHGLSDFVFIIIEEMPNSTVEERCKPTLIFC